MPPAPSRPSTRNRPTVAAALSLSKIAPSTRARASGASVGTPGRALAINLWAESIDPSVTWAGRLSGSARIGSPGALSSLSSEVPIPSRAIYRCSWLGTMRSCSLASRCGECRSRRQPGYEPYLPAVRAPVEISQR